MSKSVSNFAVRYYSETGLVEAHRTNCDCAGYRLSHETAMRDFKEREFSRKGIYLLIAREQRGLRVYVGDSGDVKDRFIEHCGKRAKFSWETALIFLNNRKDQDWNRDQTYDIQGILIGRFRERGFELKDNIQTPKRKSSEFDFNSLEETADLIEEFIAVLGYPELIRGTMSRVATQSDGEVFTCTARKSSGEGVLTDKGFLVFKGSKSAAEPDGSFARIASAKVRKTLEKNRVIDGHGVFKTDFEFSSASCAAEVLSLGPQNGLDVWRYNGEKLGDRHPELRRKRK